MKTKFILIILMLLISHSAISQFSVGISIGGIGYHPKQDKNTDFYKWKIFNHKKVVGFSALSLLLSYRINHYVGVKVVQTMVFHDCAGKFAGISHLGVDFHDDIIGWESQRDQFSFSFGPLWYYRKNWTQELTYTNDPNFITLSENKVWENKFVWHGGQIEYAYFFQQNNAFTINVLPGYPYLYTFGIGAKTNY